MLHRAIRVLVIVTASVLVLVWPVTLLVDALATTEVVPVERIFDAALAKGNLAGFDPAFAMDPEASSAVQKRQRDLELAAVYGANPRTPTTLVFADDTRLTQVPYPDRDEQVVLYVWPGRHHPLQLQTVYFAARWITLRAGIALLVLLGLAWLTGPKDLRPRLAS